MTASAEILKVDRLAKRAGGYGIAGATNRRNRIHGRARHDAQAADRARTGGGFPARRMPRSPGLGTITSRTFEHTGREQDRASRGVPGSLPDPCQAAVQPSGHIMPMSRRLKRRIMGGCRAADLPRSSEGSKGGVPDPPRCRLSCRGEGGKRPRRAVFGLLSASAAKRYVPFGAVGTRPCGAYRARRAEPRLWRGRRPRRAGSSAPRESPSANSARPAYFEHAYDNCGEPGRRRGGGARWPRAKRGNHVGVIFPGRLGTRSSTRQRTSAMSRKAAPACRG